MEKLSVAIASIVLVFNPNLTGCDRLSVFNQVLPAKEISSTPTKATNIRPTSLEQSVHQQINQYRAQHNLPPLTIDPRITQQARLHSRAMANGKVSFGHGGFKQRINAINRVIPYRSASENVAFNQGYSNPGQQAVEGWIKSPGHRINIVGQYNLTGIGIVKNAKGEYYFTQIFIRSLL